MKSPPPQWLVGQEFISRYYSTKYFRWGADSDFQRRVSQRIDSAVVFLSSTSSRTRTRAPLSKRAPAPCASGTPFPLSLSLSLSSPSLFPFHKNSPRSGHPRRSASDAAAVAAVWAGSVATAPVPARPAWREGEGRPRRRRGLRVGRARSLRVCGGGGGRLVRWPPPTRRRPRPPPTVFGAALRRWATGRKSE